MRLRRKYSFPCVVVALSLLKCASCLLDPITGLAVAGVGKKSACTLSVRYLVMLYLF